MRMPNFLVASLAQLAEHALRKRMVVGSIPTGGFSTSATRIRLREPAHSLEPKLKLHRETLVFQSHGHRLQNSHMHIRIQLGQRNSAPP